MATTPAKKTAAKKTVASKRPAKKAATKNPVSEPLTTFVTTTADIADAASERVDTAVAFVRGVVHTSIGLPFVLQSRLPEFEMASFEVPSFEMPRVDLTKFDLAPVKAVLTEAKAEGTMRVGAVQSMVAPIAAEYAKLIETRVVALADQLEAPLPEPIREYVAIGRKRVRDLLAA